MAIRGRIRAAVVVTLALAAVSGCRGASPVDHDVKAQASPDALHDLVDRRVLSSRPIDHCIDRWGKGTAGWFEVDFEIDPSGRLTPLEARGGDANLNACLFAALRKLRLPARSVPEPQRASISIH
jgi:hypothetical protein